MRSDYCKKSVFDKIYLKMQYENVLAVQVSLETGARIGDVVALKTENLKGRTITYIARKTGKTDRKVISHDLAKRLKANAAQGWIFPSPRGAKAGHRTRQAVWADINQAVKILGLDGHITPHSARKTYAVEDYHANGLNAAQKDLQHDNLNTTLIYVLSDQLGKQDELTTESDIVRLADFIAERVCKKIEQMFGTRNV